MKKMILILMAFACLIALQGQTASELYSKLQTTYKNLSSFQAVLQQSNYYPQLKKTVTYSGRIYFTQGRMLMKFTKPSEQYLKIENNRVELYDAASNTLFQSAVQAQFGRMNPVEILQFYWDKSAVTVTASGKNSASVKLVPKQDDLVSSLTATMNPSTGIVNKLGYTDKSGNTVNYSFSDIKQNASIPASVWQVSHPKNVQIIK